MSTSVLARCLDICRHQGVVVDTNLFILMIIGRSGHERIATSDLTKSFSRREYLALNQVFSASKTVYVTPQMTAEISNLIIEHNGHRDLLTKTYADKAIALINIAKENYIHKDKLTKISGLEWLGYTDLSVSETAKKYGCAVITQDKILRNYLFTLNCPVFDLKMLTIGATN